MGEIVDHSILPSYNDIPEMRRDVQRVVGEVTNALGIDIETYNELGHEGRVAELGKIGVELVQPN